MAWGAGRYVAVGGSGTSAHQPDAQTRTAVPNAVPSGNLYAVRWAGARFVAVGSISRILTSPDGLAWTLENAAAADSVYGVAWSGEQLVAAGENGSIWRSGCDGRALAVQLSGPGSGTITSSPVHAPAGRLLRVLLLRRSVL